MTISTTSSSVTYQGNGSTTNFTFAFVGDNTNDIEVYYTDADGTQTLVNPTQYTVTFNSVPVGGLWAIGGTVTYPNVGSAISSGTYISIVRDVPYTQNVSIGNQGAFYPQAVEQALDVLELQIQQINGKADRAIHVPVSDTASDTELPVPVQRSGKVIGFDDTGETVVMYDTSDVVNTRAIQVPSSDTSAQVVLPVAASRANKVIGFDATGEIVTMLTNTGGFTLSPVTITHSDSPYTVTSQNLIFVDASGGNVFIHLPTAATGNQIFVSRLDASTTYVCEVDPVGGQTINGAGSFQLKYQYQSNVFISNGSTKWNIGSQFRKPVNPTTNSYVSFINIFDVIDDPGVIAAIQSRSGWATGGYLDSYINAAIALGGMIFFPSGDYHFQNTVTMAAGVEFVGAGVENTVLFTGGTNWGFELLLPNGTQHVEAPKFRDMTIQVATTSGNGIRWNSITGGFTDTGSSQQYMMRPRVERVNFSLDTGTAGTAIQMNKCFDTLVSNCLFNGFDYPIDYEGCDINLFQMNRTDSTKTYEVKARAQNTFGSTLLIQCNDFNNPAIANTAGGFIDTTYRDIAIYDNHMELDGGVTRTNLIKVSGGNAFDTKIHNNRIEPGGFCTNWLSVANDSNHYLVSVHNNVTESSVSTMGSVSWGSQYYFNNSGGRCIVTHSGNTTGDAGFPMNYESGQYIPAGSSGIALITASRPGVSYTGIAGNLRCNSGAFILAANADTSQYLEASDWASLQMPGNAIKGTISLAFKTYADAAGQILNWEAYDNGVAIGGASGTITHTVANQFYITTPASFSVATNLGVRCWNSDTGNNGNVYIQAILIQR